MTPEERMRRGLEVLRGALNDEAHGYWHARRFVNAHGGFDGDLSGAALLAEVARLALDLPATPAPALTKAVK